MNKPKLFMLFVIIILSSNLLKAQLDSGAYSLELISIDTVISSKNSFLKDGFQYLKTTQSSNQIGIIEKYCKGKEKIQLMPESVTVELVNGNTFEVAPHWQSWVTGDTNRVIVFGNIEKYECGNYTKDWEMYYYDNKGNILNSYGNDYIMNGWFDISYNGYLAYHCTIKEPEINKRLIYLNPNGEILWEYDTDTTGGALAVEVSKCGNYIFMVQCIKNVYLNKETNIYSLTILNKKGEIIKIHYYFNNELVNSQIWFSDDEKYAYINGGQNLLVYDCKTGEEIFFIPIKRIGANYYKVINNHILLIEKKSDLYYLQIYDIETKQKIAEHLLDNFRLGSSYDNIELFNENIIKIKSDNFIYTFKIK